MSEYRYFTDGLFHWKVVADGTELSLVMGPDYKWHDTAKCRPLLRDFLEGPYREEFPERPKPTDTEEQVIADIARRRDLGRAKYGTTMERTDIDLKGWLVHAYEECLDQAIYLKRAINEMDASAVRWQEMQQEESHNVKKLAIDNASHCETNKT